MCAKPNLKVAKSPPMRDLKTNEDAFTPSNKRYLESLFKNVMKGNVDYSRLFQFENFFSMNDLLKIFLIEKKSGAIEVCNFFKDNFILVEKNDLSSPDDKENFCYEFLFSIWMIDFSSKKVFQHTFKKPPTKWDDPHFNDEGEYILDLSIKYHPSINNLQSIKIFDETVKEEVYSINLANEVKKEENKQLSCF